MPRTWTTTHQSIHPAARRRDTLDLYLNDGTLKRLSRGAVVRSGNTYTNAIRSVSDLRTSIDAGVDRITIELQNVDSLLGFNLASSLRLLDYAFGDYGRVYQSIRTPGDVVDIPQLFRGVLANAEAGEEVISFEFIVDYESVGAILASRALGPRCWWRNQNGIECTATAVCEQTRFSCASEKDFGGWEFFEEPASNLPGDGGNDGGGIGAGECFTERMVVLTPDGEFTFPQLQERFAAGTCSILTPNQVTGEISVDEIEGFFVHEEKGFYELEFEHATIECTKDHPFLVDAGSLVSADNLILGETVKAYNGKWSDSRLLRIKWHSDRTETVYCCKSKRNGMLIVNGTAVSNRSEVNI